MKLHICIMDTDKCILPDGFPLSDYRSEISLKRNSAQKRIGIACEYLLRESLKQAGLCPDGKLEIICSENGKPRFRDIPLSFNLSHSGSFAVCALSACELGIDIQKLSSYNQKLAVRYFSLSEHEHISVADNKDLSFTRLWCAKESVIKAHSSTLSKELSRTEIEIDGEGCMSFGGRPIYSFTTGGCVVCCFPLTDESCELEITEFTT